MMVPVTTQQLDIGSRDLPCSKAQSGPILLGQSAAIHRMMPVPRA